MREFYVHGRQAILAICVTSTASGVLGCGESKEERPSAAVSPRSCARVKPVKTRPASYKGPTQTVSRGERLTAIVKTSCGAFRIALDAERWPTTVNSFVFLAEKGFYDGLTFNRAAQRTYLKAGRPPDADGPGYRVQGEIPSNFTYRHGIVAMAQPAQASPGTVGSEFFIIIASPWLDFTGLYAPLGEIEKGFDVVERISLLGPRDSTPGTNNLGTPGTIGKLRRPVLIEEISIERGY